MKTAYSGNYFDQASVPDSLLKIGEVSRLSGIGVEALRFYERSGILGKPARTASGYRVYKRDVLERLAFIKKAQMLGFSLDEIRVIITESRAGECPCEEVREIVRERLRKLDEHLHDLRRYKTELAATLLSWEGKMSKGDICGFIENATIASEQPTSLFLEKKGKLQKKK